MWNHARCRYTTPDAPSGKYERSVTDGVGTMSLYRHVDDKDDLVDAVAIRVIGGVRVPDGGPDDWEARVIGYLRDLRAAAVAHLALARILAERGLTVGPVFDQLAEAH